MTKGNQIFYAFPSNCQKFLPFRIYTFCVLKGKQEIFFLNDSQIFHLSSHETEMNLFCVPDSRRTISQRSKQKHMKASVQQDDPQ